MGGVLHGSARTTPRIRAELQASQESGRALAARYGLNPKTVLKWRKRTTTSDAPTGPRYPKSTVLTPAEEAMVVAFRQKTMLPLDDVLGCLRDTIPNLSRSALHRCLQRHGISRLPKDETADKRSRFKVYQPARSGLAMEGVADWMDRRRRKVEAFGREAEAAAHDAWGKAARAGQDLAAARPSDVMALGGPPAWGEGTRAGGPADWIRRGR